MISLALLCRGRARGVTREPPRLGLPDLAGVATPMETLEALGVIVLAFSPLTEALRLLVLVASSCLAVMPTYLLALEPAVILLAAMAAFELVLFPSRVFVGRSSDKLGASLSLKPPAPRMADETVRTFPGVTLAGRAAGRSNPGVSLPDGA